MEIRSLYHQFFLFWWFPLSSEKMKFSFRGRPFSFCCLLWIKNPPYFLRPILFPFQGFRNSKKYFYDIPTKFRGDLKIAVIFGGFPPFFFRFFWLFFCVFWVEMKTSTTGLFLLSSLFSLSIFLSLIYPLSSF